MSAVSEDHWNPQQYEKFREERSRPFWDLAGKIDFKGTTSLLDVGCGTGELTRALHDARSLEVTVGVDSSRAMLDEAVKHAKWGISFERAQIETFSPNG